MATWNELFSDEKYRFKAAESEIQRFVVLLEKLFSERPLRIWDICCGTGRHTVLIAGLGHKAYASDIALNAIQLAQEWLAQFNLKAEVQLADMTTCPWKKVNFHGVIAWNALGHNTIEKIHKSIKVINNQLVPGGWFIGTFKSTKSDSYGTGRQIEPNTFFPELVDDDEEIHHYFDEKEIRELFKNWEIISLAEQVITYVEKGENFLEYNPFRYTNWAVLAKKK
jgi:SAM-dependent methyltransferase